MKKGNNNKFIIFLAIFAVSLFFSLTHIAAKEAVMKLSPWAVAMFRFITGSLTLFILMKLTGKRVELEPVDRWRFVTLAFLAVPVNQITFLTGIHYTPASHPALMYATTPAWVLLLAIWLRVEKLRWWKSAGIALAMIGVAILFAGELLSFRRENVFGDLLILVAVLSWSLYTALGKPIVERYGSLETTFLVITFGMFLYLPFGLIPALRADYSQTDATVWLAILYIGVFASGIAYYLWYWLLERIRPSQVAIVTCTQPPFTALLAWLIFGTVPTYHLLFSGVIVLTGVFLMVGYGGTKRGIGEA